MNNYDDLYHVYQQVKNQRKKDNFTSFMSKLERNLVEDLNKAYCGDRVKYETMVKNIKNQGIRVFRNESGEHKILFIDGR